MYKYNNKLITYNNKPIRTLIPFPINGLVSYWKMDETSGTVVHDSVGGNNGTINDADITWNTGLINSSLYCPFYKNGSNNISFAGVGISALPVTFNFWMKRGVNYNTLNRWRLFQLGGGVTNYDGIFVSARNTELNVETGNNGGASASYIRSYNYVDVIPDDNEWHQYTIYVADVDDRKLYIDGVEKSPSIGGTATTIVFQNYNFKLFDRPVVSTTTYNHIYLDEFGVWNRALAPEEIQALYKNGNGWALQQ